MSDPRESLPSYTTSARVRATKIVSITFPDMVPTLYDGSLVLTLEGGTVVTVGPQYRRFHPEAGGYYTFSADGSEGYQAAADFEASHTQSR